MAYLIGMNIFRGSDPLVAGSDTDGDGYLDATDAFPEDASEWLDADLDGIGDNSDNCFDR